ncbi:MAG: hypothetical protein D9C04_05155 [Nitrosopumilus sp. B06]|nr:MAG: hypothetical protein EB828_01975 [Nitrosopumilus sp. D6]RNJ79313.1 MAG: hypothetical protein D9C04_05155 [Nitrosopumilus sp. B06]
MTSRFSVTVTVSAGDKTRAVFDSLDTDNKFYPENPVKTSIKLDDVIVICSESDNLAHLRANINSTLRLVHASHESIKSAI